jgi:hypothetical protein
VDCIRFGSVRMECSAIESTRTSTTSTSLSSSNRDGVTSDSFALSKASNDDLAGLPESAAAMTALELLARFIRINQVQLDAAAARAAAAAASGKLPPVTVLTPADAPAEHSHVGEVEAEITVGSGLALADHSKESKPDRHHGDAHHSGDNHDESFLLSSANLYHDIWLNISASWSADILAPERHHALSPSEKTRVETCLEYEVKYHVKVDAGWGSMPPHLFGNFDALHCSDVISLHKVASYIVEHPEMYDRVLPIASTRQQVTAEKGMEDKVIATIVCITTRSLSITNFETDLALFKELFPSFVATVEEGFEYWFYLGYDAGDPWLDDPAHLAIVEEWFSRRVSAPLLVRGITCKLILSTWVNPYRKPGPAFNHVTGVAYADGATWIYRINDDQLFDSPWAHAMVNELLEMGPPYGVVGVSRGGRRGVEGERRRTRREMHRVRRVHAISKWPIHALIVDPPSALSPPPPPSS